MKKKVAKIRQRLKKGEVKVRNATRVVNDGINFRSKLESYTYNALKEAGIKGFEYEKLKFVLLDKFEYVNPSWEPYEKKDGDNKVKVFGPTLTVIRPMTYTPDFTCINPDKTGWIIEVKGYDNDVFPLKWKLFKKHLIDNGYNITLYKPNTQENVRKTIEQIKLKYK